MSIAKRSWDAGFYQGVLAAIHVCDLHGEQTLISEIACGVGVKQLIQAANGDELDTEILKRNGIIPTQPAEGRKP